MIVRVDMKENEYVTSENGLRLFQPPKSGDRSLSMPNHGVVIHARKNPELLNRTVYMNYRACHNFFLLEDEPVYDVPENLIVAVEGKAYKSILVEPIYDEIKSEVLEVVNNKSRLFTKARVLDSAYDVCKEGDEILFEELTCWDYLHNHKPHYYIKSPESVIRVNGQLVNNWNQLAHRDAYMEHNGIWIKNINKNLEVAEGELAGKWVLLERKPVNTNYFKTEWAMTESNQIVVI